MAEELSWTRSSFCESNGCVEVKFTPKVVWVRSSYVGSDIRQLLFSHEEWEAFVAGVKAGEFDL